MLRVLITQYLQSSFYFSLVDLFVHKWKNHILKGILSIDSVILRPGGEEIYFDQPLEAKIVQSDVAADSVVDGEGEVDRVVPDPVARRHRFAPDLQELEGSLV